MMGCMLKLPKKLVTPHTLTANTMPKVIDAICKAAFPSRASPTSK